jgi:hypothetical protein
MIMNEQLAKAFIREAKAIDDKNAAAGTPQRVSTEAVARNYVDHQQAIDAKLAADDLKNFRERGNARAKQLGLSK